MDRARGIIVDSGVGTFLSDDQRSVIVIIDHSFTTRGHHILWTSLGQLSNTVEL